MVRRQPRRSRTRGPASARGRSRQRTSWTAGGGRCGGHGAGALEDDDDDRARQQGTDCTAKRNIAKLLANSIIYRYLCSEELLEDVLGGKEALRAFRESDEKGYLEVETEGLKQLTSMGSLVLCCGDGAVMNSTNLGLLRHGVSIWIDVPLEMAVNDMRKGMGTQDSSDPNSFSQAMGKLRQRYDELKERYGVSDITVSVQNVASQLGYSSVDSVTLEDMVLEIVRQIERLIRAKAMMEAAGRPF